MKRILIFLIRCYQVIPFASHKLCRFTPTCSEYMLEAIDKYGVRNGLKLGLKRLKKCRPNGEFGYDPVPNRIEDVKMKKIKIVFILLIGLLFTTGCETNNTKSLNILTTVYPITYILENIYPEGTITSIYPSGAKINEYTLTTKQIKDYSKNDIFVYNGLANEMNTARNLINQNNKLKVIDVAYGLKNENGVEELWLSPNYYLMLATTIKNNLKEFTNNKYTNEEIEANYEKLEEKLSMLDAELRNIARSANDINKGTIITSSDVFKYLNSYGFNVISLADENNLTNISLNNIKNNFKNSTYSYILMRDTDTKTDLIKELETNYNAKIIVINTMQTLSEEDMKNNEDYLSIINTFLEHIRNITLGE